jgi:3-oxoacyl-[acyl-carrier-protein] synthase II
MSSRNKTEGTMGKTVVVTGIGIVSPVGTGRSNYWDALFHGQTGFRPISLFDTSRFKVSLAGEIPDFDPVPILGKKGLRELDRSTRLLTVAAKLALEDSMIEITEESAPAAGVAIGTTFGSLHSIFQFDRVGLTEGPRFVNPSHFPNTVINSPASRVSIRFGLKGFNTTVSTGFCAGIDAVSYASDFIRLGRADVVLAGAVEELCEETLMGFAGLGYLSGMDNSEPLCCPFDRRRNGTILSEGAAVIVLEDKDHAMKRGVPILAHISGYGNAFDPSGNRDFNNAGMGLKKAITSALRESFLTVQDIHYIAASANSTQGLDRMETEVIKDLFDERAFSIPMSSIKSMVGETFSASGALALAAAVGTIQHGIIPPTVNYREKDPSCDLDYVPNTARHQHVDTALVITSDPFGQNAAMILQKYEE